MIKEVIESLFYYLMFWAKRKRSLRIHDLARNYDIVLQLSLHKKITTYTLFNWFWIAEVFRKVFKTFGGYVEGF